MSSRIRRKNKESEEFRALNLYMVSFKNSGLKVKMNKDEWIICMNSDFILPNVSLAIIRIS